MELIQYDRQAHGEQVFDLWQKAVGEKYPLALEDFLHLTNNRRSYEDGEGVIAVEADQVIGFGMVEADYKNPLWNRWGGIVALLVDPARQRQGIGSALLERMEARMRQVGCKEMHLGETLGSFWPGAPLDLPAAELFFRRHGYDFSEGVGTDVAIALDGYEMTPAARRALQEQGAEVRCTTPETLEAVCEFERREFPDWYDGLLKNAGQNVEDIVAVWRGDEVIGSTIANTPPNHGMRERMVGSPAGGFGGVGIAEAWRGRGLGTAMCQWAALYVKRRGGRYCLIDQIRPELMGFYSRVGAEAWRSFCLGKKRVENQKRNDYNEKDSGRRN